MGIGSPRWNSPLRDLDRMILRGFRSKRRAEFHVGLDPDYEQNESETEEASGRQREHYARAMGLEGDQARGRWTSQKSNCVLIEYDRDQPSSSNCQDPVYFAARLDRSADCLRQMSWRMQDTSEAIPHLVAGESLPLSILGEPRLDFGEEFRLVVDTSRQRIAAPVVGLAHRLLFSDVKRLTASDKREAGI